MYVCMGMCMYKGIGIGIGINIYIYIYIHTCFILTDVCIYIYTWFLCTKWSEYDMYVTVTI